MTSVVGRRLPPRLKAALIPWYDRWLGWQRGRARDLRRLRRERALRSAASRERPQLEQARALFGTLFTREDHPLISVTIATYNRGQLLEERAIASVLAQTYQNFEIVIVGDGCTDDTAERIMWLNDPRIRFYNLPQRGKYPENPQHRWMVAGTVPINRAFDEVRGSWVAHLDDDDVYHPEHLETLLRFAQAQALELAYSRMARQVGPDEWLDFGGPGFGGEVNTVPHSAVLFRRYLTLFRLDIGAWRLGWPVDHHLWIRMQRAGVNVGFLDQQTVSSPLRPHTTQQGSQAEDRV